MLTQFPVIQNSHNADPNSLIHTLMAAHTRPQTAPHRDP
jgi:hypothetical protein